MHLRHRFAGGQQRVSEAAEPAAGAQRASRNTRRCGFTDQPHFSRCFKDIVGYAWEFARLACGHGVPVSGRWLGLPTAGGGQMRLGIRSRRWAPSATCKNSDSHNRGGRSRLRLLPGDASWLRAPSLYPHASRRATLVTRLAEAESRDLPDCSTESNSRPGSYLPLQIVGYKPLVAAAPIASSQRDTEAPGHHTQTGRGLTF